MGTHTSAAARRPADAAARVALDALRTIVQALRSGAGAAERRTGLSGAQLFLLQQLQSGPASINELAGRTRTHQSSVSVVVARLCRRGLARRRTDPRDARRVVIAISARGARVLQGAPAMPQERLIAAVSTLPAAERRSLARALGALARQVGPAGAKPVLFFEPE